MTSETPHLLGHMSERVLNELTTLGWNQRLQPLAPYLLELSDNGFTANEVAKAILGLFGGQFYSLPNGGISWVRFTVTEARHTFAFDRVPILEVILNGETPCPVAAGGGYIMLACPSGKVALLQEQWMYLLVGRSFADVLEAILFNDRSHCEEVENIEDYRPGW